MWGYLDRSDHLTRLNYLSMEQGEELEGINGIEAKERVGADMKHAVPGGSQIQAALSRWKALHSGAGGRDGKGLGCGIFVQVVRLGPRQRYRLMQPSRPGGSYQRATAFGVELGALPKGSHGEPDRCE